MYGDEPRQARGPSARSATDALVGAAAELGGTVLTSDSDDLDAMASHADDVAVIRF